MNSPKDTHGWKQPAAIAAIAIICIGGLASAYWFGLCDKQSCGQFGDFLGGVLNPLIGAVTLGALFWTVKAQRETLRLTRDSLEHARLQFKAESSQNIRQRVEESNARKSAMAIDNYQGMTARLERALSIRMLSLAQDNGSYCLLEVIEGAAPLDCLDQWLSTPPGARGQKHQLYSENLAIKVKLTVSAAKKARLYLPPEQWEAERRQLLAVIVVCSALWIVEKEEFERLMVDIGGGDPSELIARFRRPSYGRP